MATQNEIEEKEAAEIIVICGCFTSPECTDRFSETTGTYTFGDVLFVIDSGSSEFDWICDTAPKLG